MAEANSYIKHYSLTDIEKYLSGGMSASEMHELEKAALQDPFLADAIEGYSEAPLDVSKIHLSAIADELLANKEETKIIPISAPRRKRGWMAAASIIVLVGVGLITWITLQRKAGSNDVVAVSQVKVNSPENTIIKQDTIKSVAPEKVKTEDPKLIASLAKPGEHSRVAREESALNEIAANNENFVPQHKLAEEKLLQQVRIRGTAAVNNKEQPLFIVDGKPINIKKDTLESPLAFINADKIANVEILKDSAATALYGSRAAQGVVVITTKKDAFSDKNTLAKEYKSDNKTNTVQNTWSNTNTAPASISPANAYVIAGRITNDKGEPVASASLAANSNGFTQMTTTDARGNFSLPVKDSLLNVTVNSIGYESQKSLLNANTANAIVLKENNNLNDVIVVGYGSAKKKDVLARREEIKIDTLMPEGGWEKFNHYVVNRVVGTGSIDDLNIHGEVELVFNLDKNGKIKEVEVTGTTMNKNVSDQVAEAVKEGPKWIAPPPAKKKKNKVTIKF